jgi:hypothetical protein
MRTPHPTDPGPGVDHAPRLRACRIALYAGLLATLTACHAPSPRVTVPAQLAPAAHRPAAHGPAEGSYDWHGLLAAPFGSVLKDVPAALHEVLLFRDEAHGGTAAANDAADAECYATDAPAPLFVGRPPDEYLLCFRQNRLSRIQASVRLTAAEAPGVFGAACAAWLEHAATDRGAGEPGPEAPTAAGQSAGTCEGRDGVIRYRGHLGEEPGQAPATSSDPVLSLVLDRPSSP